MSSSKICSLIAAFEIAAFEMAILYDNKVSVRDYVAYRSLFDLISILNYKEGRSEGK